MVFCRALISHPPQRNNEQEAAFADAHRARTPLHGRLVDTGPGPIGIGAVEFPDRELFTFEDQRITHGQFHAWVNRVGKDLAL